MPQPGGQGDTADAARSGLHADATVSSLHADAADGRARARVKIPYFIGLFVVAILLNTWLPIQGLSKLIVGASHAGLTLTLFLIGSGLSRQVIRQTGVRPLMQGVIVWALIAGGTLWAILALIH